MKPPRTLFEYYGYCDEGNVTLNVGAPGPATLRKCAELMRKATEARLEDEQNKDAALLQYGSPQGDPLYISQLAQFLAAEYGDSVDPSNLVTTAGATSGLYHLMTMLFPQRCPVFVEELTYFLALGVFENLKCPVFPVTMENDGMNMEDLIIRIDTARNTVSSQFPVPDHGFWAVLLTIPLFHNPTGRCLSPEKSKQLVEVAYRNRILIISEDVYNLLYFDGDVSPMRLFAYDRERAKRAGDNTGCVISNCTFSKLLTPGLRLGWLEMPQWVRKIWDSSNVLTSGGCLNMYTSGLVGKAIEMGLVKSFIHELRVEYKKRRDVMIEKLKHGLPAGCKFEVPKGGYFIWIELPRNVKAATVQQIAKEKHKILFLQGSRSCVPAMAVKYENCIRLAISYYEESALAVITEQLTSVIAECTKCS